jgi:hypothetical protein
MRASFFTNANPVEHYSSPNLEIAACSALTGRLNAHQSNRKDPVAPDKDLTNVRLKAFVFQK